jgi:hypothetical protein
LAGREERELQIAFSEKEKTERLLSNLENLSAQGSVTPDQYTQIKAGYQNNLSVAASTILQVKSRIAQSIEYQKTNIGLFSHELQNLETRFRIGEITIEEFQKSQQKTQAKIQKMHNTVSGLQKLFNAQSSAEVGGYLDKTTGASRGMGSFPALEKKTVIGIVVILGIIAVIAAFLLMTGGQPEDAVVNFLHALDNGEYSKALDNAVNPTTLKPYTDSEKMQMITMLALSYGEHGENVQIDDIRILNKQKVNDNKYMITVSAKYTAKGLYGSPASETKTETIPVVKVDGQWKVAKQLPGFEAVLGLLGLCAVMYLRQRHHL